MATTGDRALDLLDAWGFADQPAVASWIRGIRGLPPPNPLADSYDRAYAQAETAVEEEVMGRAAAIAEASGLDAELVEALLAYALTGRPAERDALEVAAAPPPPAPGAAAWGPPPPPARGSGADDAAAPALRVDTAVRPQYSTAMLAYSRPLPVWDGASVFGGDEDAAAQVHLVSVDPSSGREPSPGDPPTRSSRSATGIVDVTIVGSDPETAAIVIRAVESTFGGLVEVEGALRRRARTGPAGSRASVLIDAYLIEGTAAGPVLAASIRRSIADLVDLLGLVPLLGSERRPRGSSKLTTPPGVVSIHPQVGKSARRRIAYPFFEAGRVFLAPRLVPDGLGSGSGPTLRTLELVEDLAAGLREDPQARVGALDLADALVQAILYAEGAGLLTLPTIPARRADPTHSGGTTAPRSLP